MAQIASAPSLESETTLGSTIGAVIAAIIGSVIICVVLGAGILFTLLAAADPHDLPFTSNEEFFAWMEISSASHWVFVGTGLWAAISTFAGLFLAFLLFRRAHKRGAIVAFTVIYAGLDILTFAPTYQKEAALGYWVLGSVLFTCVAYFFLARSENR